MNVTVEKQPSCLATVRAEIPAEDVAAERARIVTAFSSQARLRGFRKGKVPASTVEKLFGKQIDAELQTRLASKAHTEAMRKDKLRVLSFSEIENYETAPDGSVTFQSTLTLAPEIELPPYKGIKLIAPPLEVTEEEIDAQFLALRRQYAQHEDITDRGAAEGDLLLMDFTGSCDERPIREIVGRDSYLDGQEGVKLTLGDAGLLDGLSEQLLGAVPGEERHVTLTLPEDFDIESLRGKTIALDVTVKGLQTQLLPELDDEFAAELTHGNSLSELKDAVIDQLRTNKQNRIADLKTNQMVEYFDANTQFELPEELLRSEAQALADDMAADSIRSGMSEEELTTRQNELFQAATARARVSLKTNFILQEIAAAENITVSDKALAARITDIALSRREKPEKLIAKLHREGRIPSIRNQILVSKAIDFVLDNATVEELPDEPETSPQA